MSGNRPRLLLLKFMLERYSQKWIAMLLWLSVLSLILAGSLVPEPMGEDEDEMFFPQDWNLLHIPAYALLAMVSIWFLQVNWRLRLNTSMTISILFSSLLGLGVELFQPLVGRTQSLIDFGSNEIGIMLGAIVVMVFCHQRQVLRW